MKVSTLVEYLRTLPPHLHVKIATQNPKYPDDIGWDNLWTLNKRASLSGGAGTKDVVLVARRKTKKELRRDRKLGI